MIDFFRILFDYFFFEELPNNEQILSSMLSIKFWWQSCHNECCLVEWQHYDSPTSEYSNISQVQSRTVSELGLEQDTLRWLSPGSWIPGHSKWPTLLSQVSFCQIAGAPGAGARIIYGKTINTEAVNYGDVQRVEIFNWPLLLIMLIFTDSTINTMTCNALLL